MQVLRIEDSEGNGPWTSRIKDNNLALRRALDNKSCSPRFPTPYSKGEPWEGETPSPRPPHKEVFGFLFEEDLERWFGDCLPHMKGTGFKITRYEVPRTKVKVGNSGQVAFPKRKAVLVQIQEI